MDIDYIPPARSKSILSDPLSLSMSRLSVADKPAAIKLKRKVSCPWSVTSKSLLTTIQVHFEEGENSSDSEMNDTLITNSRIKRARCREPPEMYSDEHRNAYQEVFLLSHSPERRVSPLSATSLSSPVANQLQNSHAVIVLGPPLFLEKTRAKFVLSAFRKAELDNRSEAMPVGLSGFVRTIHSSSLPQRERCLIVDRYETNENFLTILLSNRGGSGGCH